MYCGDRAPNVKLVEIVMHLEFKDILFKSHRINLFIVFGASHSYLVVLDLKKRI